jgi:hypothetical protein
LGRGNQTPPCASILAAPQLETTSIGGCSEEHLLIHSGGKYRMCRQVIGAPQTSRRARAGRGAHTCRRQTAGRSEPLSLQKGRRGWAGSTGGHPGLPVHKRNAVGQAGSARLAQEAGTQRKFTFCNKCQALGEKMCARGRRWCGFAMLERERASSKEGQEPSEYQCNIFPSRFINAS